MASDLTLTAKAEERINEICNNNGKFVRVSLIGGGCHGFSYKFALDEEIHEDDYTIKSNDGSIKIAIKSAFLKKLKDSTVDFVANLTSSYFVLQSANFDSQCGCGTSFSLKE
jgi:iron-sulfur cluster assembly accessory protein